VGIIHRRKADPVNFDTMVTILILSTLFLIAAWVVFRALTWTVRTSSAYREGKELDNALKRKELARVEEQSSGG
jgi:hypothetical protein